MGLGSCMWLTSLVDCEGHIRVGEGEVLKTADKAVV